MGAVTLGKMFKALGIIALVFAVSVSTDPLKDALDAVQVYMTGEPTFDQAFYDELVACMDVIDPRLHESTGAQWDGMIKYSSTQGDPSRNDTWVQCENNSRWFEKNCTVQEYGQMPIWEPCNYASNLAYYHTTTEICSRQQWNLPEDDVKAMAMTFAILAQGSAFLHGSQTKNGDAADVVINDLFAYVAYQGAMRKVAPTESSIIHDLSLTPRAKSGNQITSDFVDMYINVPVEEWGTLLRASDIPNLRLTMCGYFGTALTLMYPVEVVDSLVDFFLSQFSGITPDIKEFCIGEFLPELRLATVNFNLPQDEFLRLEGNTYSTLIKLLYAFLWQEQALSGADADIWFQPITNQIGTVVLPLVNNLANALNNFTYSNAVDMQAGINMYPGELWCNPVIPHPKWHVQTSIALLDFTFHADEMFRILGQYNSA